MTKKLLLVTAPSIIALAAAADPPVDLSPYQRVFNNAGAEALRLARLDEPDDELIEVEESDLPTDAQLVVVVTAGRFVASDRIDDSSNAPLRDSLDRLRRLLGEPEPGGTTLYEDSPERLPTFRLIPPQDVAPELDEPSSEPSRRSRRA